MVTNLGHISGGHFNPAITLGFLVDEADHARLAVVYWVVAAPRRRRRGRCILRWLFHEPWSSARVPRVRTSRDGKALVLELIMTFFLVWAVWATAVDPRGAFKAIAGLAIGLTITIDVFVGGPVTGAAMNPARAFGPELAGNCGRAGGSTGSARSSARWSRRWLYEYLYLSPLQPPVVGTPESGVDEPRPGESRRPS